MQLRGTVYEDLRLQVPVLKDRVNQQKPQVELIQVPGADLSPPCHILPHGSIVRNKLLKTVFRRDGRLCCIQSADSVIGPPTHSTATADGVTISPTFCTGKPICYSCYEENDCYLFHDDSTGVPDTDSNWEILFDPWISCTCGMSLLCRDCYDDLRNQDQKMCHLCDGRRNLPNIENPTSGTDHDATSAEDVSDSSSSTYGGGLPVTPESDRSRWMPEHHVDDLPFLCDKDIYDYTFDNMIDWSDPHLMERLGITPSSQLGRLLTDLLHPSTGITPAKVFKIVDEVFGHNSFTMQFLNEEQVQNNAEMKDTSFITELRETDEEGSSVKLNPSNPLARLMKSVLDSGGISRQKLLDIMGTVLNDQEVRTLNEKSYCDNMNPYIRNFTQTALSQGLVMGISLEDRLREFADLFAQPDESKGELMEEEWINDVADQTASYFRNLLTEKASSSRMVQ